jgi:hypothetical protein
MQLVRLDNASRRSCAPRSCSEQRGKSSARAVTRRLAIRKPAGIYAGGGWTHALAGRPRILTTATITRTSEKWKCRVAIDLIAAPMRRPHEVHSIRPLTPPCLGIRHGEPGHTLAKPSPIMARLRWMNGKLDALLQPRSHAAHRAVLLFQLPRPERYRGLLGSCAILRFGPPRERV